VANPCKHGFPREGGAGFQHSLKAAPYTVRVRVGWQESGFNQTRPGFVGRLRDNVREAWQAAPPDIVLFSDRNTVGRVVNDAVSFYAAGEGARTFRLSDAVVRSLIPGAPAVASLPIAPPIPRTAAVPPPSPTSAPPPAVLTVIEPEPPPARPRESWLPFFPEAPAEVQAQRLERVEHFLDDPQKRLDDTTRQEREQALEAILNAVPAGERDALWGKGPEGLSEAVCEMRFHATDHHQRNPRRPPMQSLVEVFLDCLGLMVACPRAKGISSHQAGWMAHTLYRAADPEERAQLRDLFAIIGNFEGTQDWDRTLKSLRPESRPAALEYLRNAPPAVERWRLGSIIRLADKISPADAATLATVEKSLSSIDTDVEWTAIGACRQPDESLEGSLERYVRFDQAIRKNSDARAHGVMAYESWWKARGSNQHPPNTDDAVSLAEGLAGVLKGRFDCPRVARQAEYVMRECRPGESLRESGQRIEGLNLDTLDTIRDAVGRSTWEERRAAFERLLATSTGWSTVGNARFKAVAESLQPGESLAEAADQYLTLEKLLEPLKIREEQRDQIFRDVKTRGNIPQTLTSLSGATGALPDALRAGLEAAEQPLGGLDLSARTALYVKTLETVFHQSWNSDTAWPEAAACYRTLAACVAEGESVEAASARLEKICEVLKPGGVRTTAQNYLTLSVALDTVRLPVDAPEFNDHLGALRILVNSANDLNFRPSRAGREDYAFVARDRFDGESMCNAAQRFVKLASYTNPTSGKFDPRAAFSAVKSIDAPEPQKVLEGWLSEKSTGQNSRDYDELLGEFLAAQRQRLPAETLADALQRMRALAAEVAVPRPFYERSTAAGADCARHQATMMALVKTRPSEQEALLDFDVLQRHAGPEMPLETLRDRFVQIAPRFGKPADAHAAFDALMGPAPAGTGYDERVRTLLSLLDAPGSLEAYSDYCVLAEQRLEGESFDAARARLEGLRAAISAKPEDIREAYRFVTRDGQPDAQVRLIEGYLLRGNVKDAIANAVAAIPKAEPARVTRDEGKVRIGNVWVSVKSAPEQ